MSNVRFDPSLSAQQIRNASVSKVRTDPTCCTCRGRRRLGEPEMGMLIDSHGFRICLCHLQVTLPRIEAFEGVIISGTPEVIDNLLSVAFMDIVFQAARFAWATPTIEPGAFPWAQPGAARMIREVKHNDQLREGGGLRLLRSAPQCSSSPNPQRIAFFGCWDRHRIEKKREHHG